MTRYLCRRGGELDRSALLELQNRPIYRLLDADFEQAWAALRIDQRKRGAGDLRCGRRCECDHLNWPGWPVFVANFGPAFGRILTSVLSARESGSDTATGGVVEQTRRD